MEILYIAPSPPNSMNRSRSKNTLRAFHALGHSVTLMSFCKSKSDNAQLNDCLSYVDRVVPVPQSALLSLFRCAFALFLPVPLRVAYCYSFAMRRAIAQELKKHSYDLVYVKRLRLAPYAKMAKHAGVPCVLDITDSMTKYYDRVRKKQSGLEKLLSWEEYHKHRIYEKKICNALAPIVICSEQDKAYLVELDASLSGKIFVMNNSIDVEEWLERNIQVRPAGARKKLVFLGVMDYAPNILAVRYLVEEVMPLLPQAYTLSIVGAKDEHVRHLYRDTRVQFVGFVEDMKTALQEYDIFVCAIVAGSGVKNKILQASMAGLPIASTTLGIEGVAPAIRDAVLVGDAPEELARAILELDAMPEELLRAKITLAQQIIQNDNSNVSVQAECLRQLGFS